MSISEYAKERIKDFFIITTLVNIVMFILGSMYQKGATFSYEILLMPVLYGVAGTLPSWILYSKKELSIKSLLVRKILSFLVLEALLVWLTFPKIYFTHENIEMIVSFSLSVFIVYVLVGILSWFLDQKEANEMMEDLVIFQKNNIE